MKKITSMTLLCLLLGACNTPNPSQNPRSAIQDLERVAQNRISGHSVSARTAAKKDELPQLLDVLNYDSTTQTLWSRFFTDSIFLDNSFIGSPYFTSSNQTVLDIPFPLPRDKGNTLAEFASESSKSNNKEEETNFNLYQTHIKTGLDQLNLNKTPYFFHYSQERPFRFAKQDNQTILIYLRIGLAMNLDRSVMDASQRASIIIKDHLLPAIKSMGSTFSESSLEKIGVSVTYGTQTQVEDGFGQVTRGQETLAFIASTKDIQSLKDKKMSEEALVKKSETYQSLGISNMRPMQLIDLSI